VRTVPTPREQLAGILRQSRLDAGFESHGTLAKRLNVSRPVISKAENPAQPVPSDALLAAWAGVTGVGLDHLTDLAQRAKSGTPDWFMSYRAAEAEATTLRFWGPLVVPGLLQTEGYAHAYEQSADVVAARLLFFGRETAAERRLNAERGEEICGSDNACDVFGGLARLGEAVAPAALAVLADLRPHAGQVDRRGDETGSADFLTIRVGL